MADYPAKVINIQYSARNDQFPTEQLMTAPRSYDLQERLIDDSVRVIRLSAVLPKHEAGKHVASQLLRSGTSPAPNYGEAQAAESRKDFIHKIKIALKELRESLVWLRVIHRAEMVDKPDLLEPLIKETDELIAILFTSANTARENLKKP